MWTVSGHGGETLRMLHFLLAKKAFFEHQGLVKNEIYCFFGAFWSFLKNQLCEFEIIEFNKFYHVFL